MRDCVVVGITAVVDSGIEPVPTVLGATDIISEDHYAIIALMLYWYSGIIKRLSPTQYFLGGEN